MSSQVALVTTETPRSAPVERQRRDVGGAVPSAGAEQAVELPGLLTSNAPTSADEPASVIEAPELEQAVDNIRNFVTDVRRELQFSVDEDSGRTIITVIDSDSGRIIRQIPPEEVLELARSVADGAFNLIDSQA
ncbi:MAG: flagellar protein FlaG [Gammaproteobacteria bacterium]|nr:flagellar protein FlaG [Gammaproteobacteria bacterium]